jgi:hypothetical protein
MAPPPPHRGGDRHHSKRKRGETLDPSIVSASRRLGMERNACKSHLKLFDEIRAWISDRPRKQMSMEYKGNGWVRIFFTEVGW